MQITRRSLLATIKANKYYEKMPDFKAKKTQQFVTIVLTLIALSFFSLFAISPTLATIANLQRQLEDNQFVDQKLDEKIANLTSLQKQYVLLETSLPFVLGALPIQSASPIFIGQLQSVAKSTNITVINLSTQQLDLTKIALPTLNNKTPAFFSFAITADGTYENILVFLQRLTSFDRIATIESFSLNKDKETGLYRISLRGKTYFKG